MIISKLRSGVFYKWIVSYILILFIPISLGVALLGNTQKIVVNEYKTMSKILYQQVGKVIDTNISTMDTIRNLLLNNTDLDIFANLEPDMTEENWYSLVKIQKQILSYAASYEMSMFYIYINNIDRVITPNSLYSKELAFSTYHNNSAIDMEEWFEYVNEYHYRTIHILKDKDSAKVTTVMISSVPALNIYKPRAVIVQILDDKVIADLLKDISIDEHTHLMLINNDNSAIISNHEAEGQSILNSDVLKGSSGQVELEIEREKKLVFYQDSNLDGWKFVVTVPKEAVNNKTGRIKIYTIGFFIFSIVTGFIISYLIARHNYNPISRIINKITPYVENNCDGHEYNQIETAFSNIIEAKEKLDVLWEKQALYIQNNFIESLLKGQISDLDHIQEVISTFDIHFKSNFFCVLVLCAQGSQNIDNKPDFDLIFDFFKYLKESIQSKLNLSIDMYPVEMESLVVLLVNFDTGFSGKEYNEIYKLIEELSASYDDKMFATVSNICNGLSTVHFAYSEAMESMNYKLFTYRDNPSALANTQNAEPVKNKIYIYTFNQEQQLINRLCNGNTSAVLSLFDEICWNNFTQNHISFNMVRCLFYDIAASVFKAVDKQTDMDESVLKKMDKLISKLNHAQSSSEMSNMIKKMLTLASNNFQTPDRKISLHEEIILCVKQHYNEVDFNVSKVADYLSMNMSYISKYFKDSTGVGLLDYINGVRISHAKEMLSNSDDTISNISVKVGFENINSFIRVFKKYEGITPGLYLKTGGSNS